LGGDLVIGGEYLIGDMILEGKAAADDDEHTLLDGVDHPFVLLGLVLLR